MICTVVIAVFNIWENYNIPHVHESKCPTRHQPQCFQSHSEFSRQKSLISSPTKGIAVFIRRNKCITVNFLFCTFFLLLFVLSAFWNWFLSIYQNILDVASESFILFFFECRFSILLPSTHKLLVCFRTLKSQMTTSF